MVEVVKLNAKQKVVAEKGFSRATKYDFSDDGNNFNGWMWKDKLPLTQHYSDGNVYLCVRADYLFGTPRIPYSFYSNYIDFDKVYKYNGTSNKLDLDDLASICEETWAAVEKAKEDFANLKFPDLSDKAAKLEMDICEAEDLIKRNINWFEMNLSESGIKRAYEIYNNIKKYLVNDYATLEAIKNQTLPMYEAVDLKGREKYEAHCAYLVSLLKELIEEKSYDWYYVEKKPSMR